ncbi:Lsr2 dimerization domain-containing protein [Ornithinimicrobium flavum]|uniref:Lsr2 dimerization domain-containing protein n=1 Tax=Ornithinimicrobium flavum TaxID=1288636 RepID=UPI00106F41F2|nr:histone-like nucleoid-structuring protein Lsr2 [Ornithinimicrobium flavum]
MEGQELGEDRHAVKFGFRPDYEIDLSQQEAEEFANTMQKYQTPLAVSGVATPGAHGGVSTGREQLRKMRDWARETAIRPVSSRGRIHNRAPHHATNDTGTTRRVRSDKAPDLNPQVRGLVVLVGDTGFELLRTGATTDPFESSTLLIKSHVRGHISAGHIWTDLDRF